MAAAKQCDRCGKLFVRTTDPMLRVIKVNPMLMDTYYDLCDECQDKFEEFMENKDVKE